MTAKTVQLKTILALIYGRRYNCTSQPPSIFNINNEYSEYNSLARTAKPFDYNLNIQSRVTMTKYNIILSVYYK